MSIGFKIKNARMNMNWTQEELANKLGVSRQAITKWESDKGIPDIENLKRLSSLLGVSIDYLISDNNCEHFVFKEKIDLSVYGKKRKKVIKDMIVRSYFKDELIETLIAQKVLTKGEKYTDFFIGFFTNGPFGIPQFLNSLKDLDRECYLVTRENDQLIVFVSNEFIEYFQLDFEIDSKTFIYNGYKYTNCGPIVYA